MMLVFMLTFMSQTFATTAVPTSSDRAYPSSLADIHSECVSIELKATQGLLVPTDVDSILSCVSRVKTTMYAISQSLNNPDTMLQTQNGVLNKLLNGGGYLGKYIVDKKGNKIPHGFGFYMYPKNQESVKNPNALSVTHDRFAIGYFTYGTLTNDKFGMIIDQSVDTLSVKAGLFQKGQLNKNGLYLAKNKSIQLSYLNGFQKNTGTPSNQTMVIKEYVGKSIVLTGNYDQKMLMKQTLLSINGMSGPYREFTLPDPKESVYFYHGTDQDPTALLAQNAKTVTLDQAISLGMVDQTSIASVMGKTKATELMLMNASKHTPVSNEAFMKKVCSVDQKDCFVVTASTSEQGEPFGSDVVIDVQHLGKHVSMQELWITKEMAVNGVYVKGFSKPMKLMDFLSKYVPSLLLKLNKSILKTDTVTIKGVTYFAKDLFDFDSSGIHVISAPDVFDQLLPLNTTKFNALIEVDPLVFTRVNSLFMPNTTQLLDVNVLKRYAYVMGMK